ncbi:transglycosylase domain-containing protein [Rheinheimera marina]|uniref:peptidoglycan glycosyltransferase n=1 Tax=Rheinheimera marina TaxID=1774958 RepID=A0ABV9JNX6_9GAMM
MSSPPEMNQIQFDNYREDRAPEPEAPAAPVRKRKSLLPWLFLLLLLSAAALVAYELHTAHYQSTEITKYAKKLTYQLKDGPTDQVIYPVSGPFDHRLGYSKLPKFLPRLTQNNFVVERQAQFSAEMQFYSQLGFFPPYREKAQAGLLIGDCRNEQLFSFAHPQRVYQQPADVPALVRDSLLFIENRKLLTSPPRANPAVDWPRFIMAAVSQVGKVLNVEGQSAGGSTLATQIEKYRHSPQGLTRNFTDKFLQMVSGSVRAYRYGSDTSLSRHEIVLDYLNSVPLSSAPGFGEVHGVGDALWAWFGTDFNRFNQVLKAPLTEQNLKLKGLALRQALALMIAQRRPSYYLLQGHDDLEQLTDSHLRVLSSARVVDKAVADAAIAQRLVFKGGKAPTLKLSAQELKGINVARGRLGNLLNQQLYDLDRLDLTAKVALHNELQQKVSQYLNNLASPAFAEKVGLLGERLLTASTTDQITYSFTLFERTPTGNRVRVQTDNTDQPFDLNEQSKLELGSTAKLRVLTTYLEIIAELHDAFAEELPENLLNLEIAPNDQLTRWAAQYMAHTTDRDLTKMLDAALQRTYSASPNERFFTGGGSQVFGNFQKKDDAKVATMLQSLQESLNLPFVRLMRDIVAYSSSYQTAGSSSQLLKNDNDPRREEYLRKFVDKEGTTFLSRFWRKYQKKTEAERLDMFFEGLKQTPDRLAAVHRYLLPDSDFAVFSAFLQQRLPEENLTVKDIDELYNKYGPGKFSLPDQGYIARVHPLELWLLSYLQQNPEASFQDAVDQSKDQRQQVYRWLFKTSNKSARDTRVRIMLEVEAFLDIHQRWKKLGYPFDFLVPSLGTALGSSGDRPAALAELIGIIQNGGLRLPTVRVDALHFAAGTPYETQLRYQPAAPERVMKAEVAAALKHALSMVVADGSARRLKGSFLNRDQSEMAIGGKTGTGDNKVATQVIRGKTVAATKVSRTATFVFYLGDNYFGTLTAFVPGKSAENFSFTSALPLQVLKGMAPLLTPYVQQQELCQ